MRLADVVEQGHHNHAVIQDGVHDFSGSVIRPETLPLFPHQQPPQGIQDVEAVLEQAARACQMVLGAGGGAVEIAALYVLQELVHAGPLDFGQFRFKAGDVVLDIHD